MPHRIIAFLILNTTLQVCVNPTHAEVVITVEGDRIDGDVASVSDGILLVKSPIDDTPDRSIALMDIDRILYSNVAAPEGSYAELIDNDGKHAKRTVSAKVKLRAGMHRMVIAFVQGAGDAHLNVQIKGPELKKQPLALRMVYHVPNETQAPASPGLDDEGYRLPENPQNTKRRLFFTYYPGAEGASDTFTTVASLSALNSTRTGTTNRVSVREAEQANGYGLVFTGYVKVDHDGEYTFYLTSASGSKMYLGQNPFLRRGTPVNARWSFQLSGGGFFAGQLKQWRQETLTVSHDEIDLSIPVAQIRKIQTSDPMRQRHSPDPARVAANEDTVFVIGKNGELQHVIGQALGIEADDLLFSYQDQQRRIQLQRVVSIHLAVADRKPAGQFHQVLQLVTGQLIPGQWVEAEDDHLGFETTWGQRLDVAKKRVALIQTRLGRLVYLTDLEPQAEHTPYFDRVIPYRVNTWPGDKPIQLSASKVDSKGLCTHSRTVLQYDLDGAYDRFQAEVGLQYHDGRLGNVDLRVTGDDRVLYEKIGLTHDQPPQPVDVDVSGTRRLTLEVDFGEGQDVGDRVAWAEPRLLRAKTTAPDP